MISNASISWARDYGIPRSPSRRRAAAPSARTDPACAEEHASWISPGPSRPGEGGDHVQYSQDSAIRAPAFVRMAGDGEHGRPPGFSGKPLILAQ